MPNRGLGLRLTFKGVIPCLRSCAFMSATLLPESSPSSFFPRALTPAHKKVSWLLLSVF